MVQMMKHAEKLIAAERARNYPANRARRYFHNISVPMCAASAAAHTVLHPEDIKNGWPAVAVAEFRNELTEAGIVKALLDLNSLIRGSVSYTMMLEHTPKKVAMVLEEQIRKHQAVWAAKREAKKAKKPQPWSWFGWGKKPAWH